MGLWDSLLNWLRSLFFKQEMELSLVGLQNAGKTSLVNAIATGGYSEDMIPTVGFNMRKVTKGNVTIKIWDLGGQRRFRTMWERYCRGVSAIVYVIDAADRDSVPISRSELHDLLTKPSLNGIPLLILGNKIDKSEALSKPALVDQLGLDSVADREQTANEFIYLIGAEEETGFVCLSSEKHFPFIHSVKHMLVVLVKIRDPVGLLRLEPKLSDKVNLQLFRLNLVYTA
ncbi:hypothetical protein HID58_061587 [Brassica napus]|uniref:Uncharacterized protein n=2 Tax=Brassica TaxID=3705 RepID=A0ABQ7ZZ01_BRANA|nr:hypothetical protein HID58_061587 [Brassica napus]VDD11205.1 unnamed protein product [Brassica oleracea]